MNRFHSGNRGGFASLLRSMSKNKSIQIPANNLQHGAKPEHGGSTQRHPNNKSTQRHMDAKDNMGTRVGRRGSGAGQQPTRSPKLDPEHRIARGSPGTEGRTIHHKTHIKPHHSVPGEHLIGARRTNFSKTRTGMHKGSAGMSDFVNKQHGVPGHQSVINRGIVPSGGYKATKGVSRARVSNLAHKLDFHTSVH
jgi:hypothetical protein